MDECKIWQISIKVNSLLKIILQWSLCIKYDINGKTHDQTTDDSRLFDREQAVLRLNTAQHLQKVRRFQASHRKLAYQGQDILFQKGAIPGTCCDG